MASNPYVNKVVYGNQTIIDLTDATATAAQILEGYTAYGASGQKLTGTASGQALVITDTLDEHGGTIRTITGKVVQLQTKTITPTSSQQVVNPDTGYDGFSQVTVEAGGSTINNQDKSVSPTESQQIIEADSGYTGLGTVTVGAISSTYVGSGISRKSSSDLTASGATVTAPAGYYSSNATKTISSGSATPASSISGTSASVSTGTNTITLTKSVSNTPQVSAGYISSGTAGNTSVSLTASVTTKAAATITPGTSNQEIAAGTYLTGKQTIAGDADLTAANIKTGVQIFNVTGTFTADATAAQGDIVSGQTAYVNGSKVTGNLVINKYYTGSSAPSASLGNNGDIYFQQ